MNIRDEILIYGIIWLAVLVLIFHKSWKNRGTNSGMTIIYVANFFLMHGFAALIYLLPWHQYIDGKLMYYGLRESTYAAVAFAIGDLVFAPVIIGVFFKPRKAQEAPAKTDPDFLYKLATRYFWIGVISNIVLPPLLMGYPTITSLVTSGQLLTVVAMCYICWQSWNANNMNRFRRWLYIAFSFPFLSVLIKGFLGFGTLMSMIVLFFVARFYKPKWKVILAGVIFAYLGLSFYLTYMRDRSEMREATWGARAVLPVRIGMLKKSLSNPIWLNIFNLEHLETVDGRMNQNYLIGSTVDYIQEKRVEYAGGATIRDSLIALIPRMFWKEKPLSAGNTDVVTKYTGIEFHGDTSVRMGQVMELYVNFGRMGVLIGFLLIGIIIEIMDVRAGYYLMNNNLRNFVIWFLPGISSIFCGNFVETTASFGAAVFTAFAITSSNIIILIAALYLLAQFIGQFASNWYPF